MYDRELRIYHRIQRFLHARRMSRIDAHLRELNLRELSADEMLVYIGALKEVVPLLTEYTRFYERVRKELLDRGHLRPDLLLVGRFLFEPRFHDQCAQISAVG